MSEILEYIENFKAAPVLPYVHTTVAQKFIDQIMKTGMLEPELCDVFNENLLYIFYGRPAYKRKNEIIYDSDLYPICFILKPTTFTEAKRIYPFDTGAFYQHRYDEFFKLDIENNSSINRKEIINKFLLGDNLDLPPKFVSAFFGGNKQYINGQIKKGLEFKISKRYLGKYYKIASEPGSLNADDRKYTIEIQISEKIKIQNNVLAVVVPAIADDDAEIRDLIKNKWNAKLLKYRTPAFVSSDSIYGALYEQVAPFLEKYSGGNNV